MIEITRNKICMILSILLALLFFSPDILSAQTAAEEGSSDLIDNEFYYFYLLDDQLNVNVDIASMFIEDELDVGSSVTSINSSRWRMLGARRTYEAIGNVLSVIPYNLVYGGAVLSIRGYSTLSSVVGSAMLLDGVPLNAMATGSSFMHLPNWELGTLEKIEMIKGPGSAIYGTDAFHGVISMKSFESDKDLYSVEGAGAYPIYGDANIKISQGIAGDILRVDLSAAASGQGDQDIEYEYNDNGETGKGKYKNKYSNHSAVLKLSFKPSDKLKIKFGGYANKWSSEDFNDVTYNEYKSNLRDNDLASAESLFLMGNASAAYAFVNDISIEASGFFWQGEYESNLSQTPGTPLTDKTYLLQKETDTRAGADIVIKQPDNFLNLQWLLAYSYNTEEAKDTNATVMNEATGDELIDLKKIPYDGEKTGIHSAFTQLKWEAVKKYFYILLGGRLDHYSCSGTINTPRVGLIFQPTADNAVKALYGRAFNAPTNTMRYGQKMVYYGNKDLDPQTIDVYELIYIHKAKDWKLNVTGFYSYWKDGIVLKADDSLPIGYSYVFLNEGKNRSYGDEIQIYYAIASFTFDIGLSYVKSEAIDAEDPDDPANTKNIKYDAFPTYSFITGILYNLKPYDINFFLNNRLYWDMYETPDGVRPASFGLDRDKIVYQRVDLNISKVIADKTEISVNIRNLLNRENRTPSLHGSLDGYEEPGTGVLLRAAYRL